ncbi:MAG: GMC family oxidoreductase [Saprospirales bacterium]|nr:GMC family oxidoreductase [Saprospirales bacterium]
MYDYIIIGSGFGGSVSAMRLSEKGYRVLVLEKGKRYQSKDFPKTNWNIRKYLWAPLLRCFGIQQLSFFKEVFVIHGVGVGGGSLVYANTHLEPGDEFYQNPRWAHFRDWRAALGPFYQKARYMLGSTPAKNTNVDDKLLAAVARDMGQEESFRGVDVGVYYGDPDTPVDPYFEGKGPLRNGCIECAGCMVGCRHNAKNTLDKNYLYFAEQQGAEVLPETLAYKVEWDPEAKQYAVHTRSSTSAFGRKEKTFYSKGIVFSAGVLGTLKLLLAQKQQYGTLPLLSDRLGENLRTNSESLCGVVDADEKLNNGVAISSIIQADAHTNIELCKFSDRSGLMLRLGALATGDGSPLVRIAKLVGNIFRHPGKFMRALFSRDLASNGVVLLVMQTLDNSMRMVWKNGRMRMDNSAADYQRVPAFIPKGQDVMHRYAEKSGGIAMNALTEIAFNMASTAHILGGCPMGRDAAEGVVNERFEVFGYPNMYILDGSIMPCNPGVNPSLTITALSEYAMAQIP